MKAKVVLLSALAVVLTGCGVYGDGETVGYVYAVDNGILWDKVWFKTSLEASESDCYLIDNDTLKGQIRDVPSGTKLRLSYSKHFFTASICPEGTSTNDEITSVEIL